MHLNWVLSDSANHIIGHCTEILHCGIRKGAPSRSLKDAKLLENGTKSPYFYHMLFPGLYLMTSKEFPTFSLIKLHLAFI